MPKYGFLRNRLIDGEHIERPDARRTALVGVPYTDEMIAERRGGFHAPGRSGRATTTGCWSAIPRRRSRNFDGAAGHLRNGCADRLSADAGHAGRLLDLHARREPVGRATMDTYSILREFADSWVLLFMFVFFVGVDRLGVPARQRQVHSDTADIIFRHEDKPARRSRRGAAEDAGAKEIGNEQETKTSNDDVPTTGHAGTGSRNTTTRCRAGGCGPSTPRSSGA